MKRTRTTISLERRKIQILRAAHRELQTFCRGCAKDVRMIGATEAAAMFGTSTNEIYSRVATDAVHFQETNDGLLLICASSLVDVFAVPGPLVSPDSEVTDAN